MDCPRRRTGLKREQIIVRSSGGNTFGKQLDAALRSLGRKGLDVVFDSLGGDYFMPAYHRMNAMGRHIQGRTTFNGKLGPLISYLLQADYFFVH